MRLHVSGKFMSGLALLGLAGGLFLGRDAIPWAVFACGIDSLLLFFGAWTALRVLPIVLAVIGTWKCLDAMIR